MTNHQRVGAISNAHAGREFEVYVRDYFKRKEGLVLEDGFAVEIGVSARKKSHKFDLGSDAPPILVECKSHTWTETGNMPSAKLKDWNLAMYFFHLAPGHFKKVLCVLWHARREETLAEYYVRLYSHLIPHDVAILELDPDSKKAHYLKEVT